MERASRRQRRAFSVMSDAQRSRTASGRTLTRRFYVQRLSDRPDTPPRRLLCREASPEPERETLRERTRPFQPRKRIHSNLPSSSERSIRTRLRRETRQETPASPIVQTPPPPPPPPPPSQRRRRREENAENVPEQTQPKKRIRLPLAEITNEIVVPKERRQMISVETENRRPVEAQTGNVNSRVLVRAIRNTTRRP